MGRPKRVAKGGIVYHVLNRANARMTIFDKDADYEAFEKVLEEANQNGGTVLQTSLSHDDQTKLQAALDARNRLEHLRQGLRQPTASI